MKIKNPIFICNYYRKKIDCGEQLNMTLCEHITNNQSNLKFVPILNKIEEHLITPHLAFTQIFQLKGYGQYEMHKSIVNIPKKLDLVQIILLRLPYDDSSILVFFEKKIRIQIHIHDRLCLS
jgi:hypothetical protein